MAKYIFDLAKIEMGALEADGGTATVWAEVFSDSVLGSVAITSGDPTVTSIRVLEKTKPIISQTEEGDTTVTFSTYNTDAPALQYAFGGTLTGIAPDQTWHSPASTQELMRSVRFTTPGGRIITINKLNLAPKLGIIFDEGDAGKIDFTGVVLEPTKAGVSAITIF